MRLALLFAITAVAVIFAAVAVTADEYNNNNNDANTMNLRRRQLRRGTWSDTVKDLIAATQDDPAYRRIVLQELLSSSSQEASFADTVCSHPEIMRCLGNSNDNKGSATSLSWPVEITISKFNGTVHWEKLPKATQALRIVDATHVIDVSELIKKLPTGLESLEFVRCNLTLSEAVDVNGNNNNNVNDNGNGYSNNNNAASGGGLVTLSTVRFISCRLTNSVLEQMWLPVSALRVFEMRDSVFATPTVAPMLLMATELEEIRVVSNRAPIRFRELLVELVARVGLKTIDFQAYFHSPGDELLPEMGFPRSLTYLRLCNLSLRDIPKVLPPQLTTLSMPFNRLAGRAPDLSETVLEEIDFSNNTIAEFPTRLPASIRRIRVPSNRIAGTIDLTSLPRQLLELNVAHNLLSGNVDLTKLPPRLEILDIAFNSLTGPINMREFPDSVKYVFLQNNEFTGRYDVSRLPLMSVRVLFGGNKWDSLLPKA